MRYVEFVRQGQNGASQANTAGTFSAHYIGERPMSSHARSRLDYERTAPNAYQAMAKLSDFVRNCGLENSLLELVMVRVSQMNGCAYCVDWHARRARDSGETERRLYSLAGWREAPTAQSPNPDGYSFEVLHKS